MYDEVKIDISDLIENKLGFCKVGVVVAKKVTEEIFLQLPNDIEAVTLMLVKHRECFCKKCRNEIRSDVASDITLFLRTGYCIQCLINKYG